MKYLFLTIIFTFFMSPCFGQISESLTNEDYAEIIRAILIDNRFEKQTIFPDEVRKKLFLSTENIKEELLPSKQDENEESLLPAEIKDVKIIFKTPTEIAKEKKNWRRYCAFGNFQIEDSVVTVDFFYYGKNTRDGEFLLATMEYKYRKNKDKWEMIRKTPKVTIS